MYRVIKEGGEKKKKEKCPRVSSERTSPLKNSIIRWSPAESRIFLFSWLIDVEKSESLATGDENWFTIGSRNICDKKYAVYGSPRRIEICIWTLSVYDISRAANCTVEIGPNLHFTRRAALNSFFSFSLSLVARWLKMPSVIVGLISLNPRKENTFVFQKEKKEREKRNLRCNSFHFCHIWRR